MAWSRGRGAASRRASVADWLSGAAGVSRRASYPASDTAGTGSTACPELDCLRDLLPRRVIAAAEHRAKAIGTGAERVLICADAITEEAYLLALARALGTTYRRLDCVTRDDCPLNDDELTQAAAAGLLPLWRDGNLTWVIAPYCETARRLADPRIRQPGWLHPFCLTSCDEMRRFVTRHANAALGRKAAGRLHRLAPVMSSAPQPKSWRTAAAIGAATVGVIPFVIAPLSSIAVFGVALCAVFLATALLRLWCAFLSDLPPRTPRRVRDQDLPIYTIVCALYREAAVVDDLVTAIRALDYPPEKLDIKIVVEPDDRDTRRALAALELGPPFEIINAPASGPRTKPKALNAALPFIRGAYTVVFDAEDRPDTDQLRRAVAAFRSADHRLACLQASLIIDNTADNWLAAMFTAAYAGQFDVLMPALAAMHLPFPLGGSSNHFRTAALRKIGAWDPYNVTEDADLGIRLCRFGYRLAALPSATYEEAPTRFIAWLKQRTRWYKGWMQTWLVHMRQPRRLWRELGAAKTVSFQLWLAGSVMSALLHPVFMAGLCYLLLTRPPLQAIETMGAAFPVFTTTLLCGYVSSIVLDAAGLRRRGLLKHAWVLALTPVYWFLLSLAAWRALFQLVLDPQRWEKTEHGLARSSRRAQLAIINSDGRLPPPHDRDLGRMPVAPLQIMSTARDHLPRLDRRARKSRE